MEDSTWETEELLGIVLSVDVTKHVLSTAGKAAAKHIVSPLPFFDTLRERRRAMSCALARCAVSQDVRLALDDRANQPQPLTAAEFATKMTTLSIFPLIRSMSRAQGSGKLDRRLLEAAPPLNLYSVQVRGAMLQRRHLLACAGVRCPAARRRTSGVLRRASRVL